MSIEQGAVTETGGERKLYNFSGLQAADYLNTPLLDLLDQERCYQELIERLHDNNLRCECDSGERVGHGKTKAGFPVFRCKGCGRTYSVLTGTVFSGTSLDARGLLLFMRLLGEGASDVEIGVAVSMHRNSVSDFRRKIELYRRING